MSAKRSDLVGNYLGETEIKTKNFIRNFSGKTISVSGLVMNENDSFGQKAKKILEAHGITVILLE